MALVDKRVVMVLYSCHSDPYSHQVRVVLAEKGVNVDIQTYNKEDLPEKLLDINPYNSLPTLVDRELVLYHAPIIMEYLDERFPHPSLLPIYPVARAESRKMLFRIEHDWYRLMKFIESSDDEELVNTAREQLRDSLISLSPVFDDKDYFLSDDFTLVDCCIAPLLWRLPKLGIQLPAQADAIKEYMDRVFNRESFQASLTDVERELRVA